MDELYSAVDEHSDGLAVEASDAVDGDVLGNEDE